MNYHQFIILFLLLPIILNQNFKEEQRKMLTKLKELLKSTYFPANKYKDYAINVESISHVYLDSISASNREQIKTRYKFPEAIINKLMAVLYSNHVSVYERIEYVKPTNITQKKAEYSRIIGFAKKIGNMVTFTVARGTTTANLIQKKEEFKKKVCWKTFIFFKKCEWRSEWKDRGYNNHELNMLQNALDIHNQISIRDKINSISYNDEIVISSSNSLYSLDGRLSMVIHINGQIAIYEKGRGQVGTFGVKSNNNNSPYTLRVKSDGNIVICNKYNVVVFETNTGGKGKYPFNLILSNDKNLVLLDQTNRPIWDRIGKFKDKQNLLLEDYRIESLNKQYYASIRHSKVGVFSSKTNEIVKEVKIKPFNKEGPHEAYIESDGNWVVRDKYFYVLFTSKNEKTGIAPFIFKVTDDGNLNVVDSKGTVVYST